MSPMALLNVAVAAERMSLFNSISQHLKEHRCAEIVSHAIQLEQSKSSEGEARELSGGFTGSFVMAGKYF